MLHVGDGTAIRIETGRVHLLLLACIHALAPSTAAPLAGNQSVPVATFNRSSGIDRAWRLIKDPVMGRSSNGSWSVTARHTGLLDGMVGDMPIIRWPSFIKVETQDLAKPFPDVSMCHAFALVLRSSVAYTGYHFAFGKRRPDFFKPRYGFKARIDAPLSGPGFSVVSIPFSNFTSDWNDETGDPVHTCQEDARNCPTHGDLANLEMLGIWAEGVSGKVHLEVKEILATGCDFTSNSRLKYQGRG